MSGAVDPNPLLRWEWIPEQWTSRILPALLEHLQVTSIAIGCGFLLSVCLAGIALRYRWAMAPISFFTAFLYTIPSVAFYGILRTTSLGTSILTVVIPLTCFTLLTLVGSVVDGFRSIPGAVREAAQAMGIGAGRRILTIEVPIVIPYVISGLRIATVTTVGLVAVAAIVGHGGLGNLILDGLRRTFWTPLTLGATLSIALALTFDVAFVALGRLLTPWARTQRSGR